MTINTSASAEPEPRSLRSEMPAAEPRPLKWLADGLQGRASVARAAAQAANKAYEASASSVSPTA